MLEITSHRQGAILNHNHGIESENALCIIVSGISDGGYPVSVNGVPTVMDGRNFTAEIELKEQFNDVCAEVHTPYGVYAQKLTLVWDKKSFPRFNYYLDDHSFLFTDLAEERPTHAFDHFYLKGLKEINRKYGLKVTLNCFYHNDHHDFDLCDMPDIWKSEFIDNSDWLKFSFHSYSEFPDRPYAEASGEEFGRDFDLVQNEIIRFAGKECFIMPNVIHWANIHPACAQELIRRGLRCYFGMFRLKVMGGPSLADRQQGGNMNDVEKRSISGSDKDVRTAGLALHYGFQESENYIKGHRNFYDPELGVTFLDNIFCSNLTPISEMPALFAAEKAQSARTGNEIFGLGGHEQYSFPYYSNYEPDHIQRIEESTRFAVEKLGASPVFFAEGFLGNTAWER